MTSHGDASSLNLSDSLNASLNTHSTAESADATFGEVAIVQKSASQPPPMGRRFKPPPTASMQAKAIVPWGLEAGYAPMKHQRGRASADPTGSADAPVTGAGHPLPRPPPSPGAARPIKGNASPRRKLDEAIVVVGDRDAEDLPEVGDETASAKLRRTDPTPGGDAGGSPSEPALTQPQAQGRDIGPLATVAGSHDLGSPSVPEGPGGPGSTTPADPNSRVTPAGVGPGGGLGPASGYEGCMAIPQMPEADTPRFISM